MWKPGRHLRNRSFFFNLVKLFIQSGSMFSVELLADILRLHIWPGHFRNHWQTRLRHSLCQILDKRLLLRFTSIQLCLIALRHLHILSPDLSIRLQVSLCFRNIFIVILSVSKLTLSQLALGCAVFYFKYGCIFINLPAGSKRAREKVLECPCVWVESFGRHYLVTVPCWVERKLSTSPVNALVNIYIVLRLRSLANVDLRTYRPRCLVTLVNKLWDLIEVVVWVHLIVHLHHAVSCLTTKTTIVNDSTTAIYGSWLPWNCICHKVWNVEIMLNVLGIALHVAFFRKSMNLFCAIKSESRAFSIVALHKINIAV